jgi:spore germination protein
MKHNNHNAQDTMNVTWDEADVKCWFEGSKDVLIEKQQIGNGLFSFSILTVYCSSLIDTNELRRTILPHLHEVLENGFSGDSKELELKIVFPKTLITSDLLQEDIAQKIFEG